MRKLLKITIPLFILLFSLQSFIAVASPIPTTKADFRGLWVSTVVNIDYPSKPTTNVETLKSEAIKILDNALDTGFNAVFLQVRPTADAFYKSAYFPWSKYLTGTQGLMPNDNFDPLEFWVTEAHKRGIELHAWVNPYRITKNTSSDLKWDFNSLDPTNPARLNPNWVVRYTDGNLYFDPGIPEVRQLIVNSVLEIVQNYNVDGIHMDDYFYPGTDFNDTATFNTYGTDFGNIDDWRRDNVNTLIRNLSENIKAIGKNVRFGISPFGIWANRTANSLGSDTHGMQSYYNHYADTRKWVKEGLLDYIVPQIYWYIGYSVADYSKLLSWWNDTVSGTGVDLYIGQAAYLSENSNPSSTWYGDSQIVKQLELNTKYSGVKGSIFFTYNSFEDSPSLTAVVKAIFKQRDGVITTTPVDVSRPNENIRTCFSKFYLNGSSDSGKPLYLNGVEVSNRSAQGYFGILVPLSKGANVFTFSQEASFVTRVIYRETESSVPQKMSAATIPASSTFPLNAEYRTSGEKITLSCTAPIGSKVTVKLGGKTYTMKPSRTTPYGSGAYPTKFTYVYKVPTYKGTPRVIDLGAPIYTMKYKGVVKTRKAPAKIGVIMKNAPFYARVIKEVIDTYQKPTADNGAAYELYNGMIDYITGMTGSYVRLSSGQWVKKSGVKTYTSKTQIHASIKNVKYEVGDKWDSFNMDISSPVASIASFDGKLLKLTVSTAVKAALPVLPDDSLFSSVKVSKSNNQAKYTLTLKENQNIEGYDIQKTSTGIILQIKRPVKTTDLLQPLKGITIMVDPGHGGTETGAVGPLGINYAEKTINLNTALKLQNELTTLGANVLMTRASDTTLSLSDRLAASRNAKPDMFISLHANSMEDNVDISAINGLSVFYRETLAGPLANTVLNNAIGALNRNNHGVHVKNFYVLRGTWTPSILIETGFVPNPNEFEWLTDENGQTQIAKSISDAVVEYFSK